MIRHTKEHDMLRFCIPEMESKMLINYCIVTSNMLNHAEEKTTMEFKLTFTHDFAKPRVFPRAFRPALSN